eukprot:GHVU01205861.1.p1 GENE.GHVU01205861.1~~GHVU01205861.1.p1  ORF type:complete len:102 (-),score=0.60 GHVU01205861.1:60-365(-)
MHVLAARIKEVQKRHEEILFLNFSQVTFAPLFNTCSPFLLSFSSPLLHSFFPFLSFYEALRPSGSMPHIGTKGGIWPSFVTRRKLAVPSVIRHIDSRFMTI